MAIFISGGASSCPALNFSDYPVVSPLPPPRVSTKASSTVAFQPTQVKSGRVLKRKSMLSAVAAAKGRLGSLRGGGAGLLERPTFDQSQFDPLPQVQEGGDIGQLSNRKYLGSGDSYKVLLVDDLHHTEKLVVNALPQAVPSITVDDARKVFDESRRMGVAVVIVTVKEHAEFYAQMMIRRGMCSVIEPDSR